MMEIAWMLSVLFFLIGFKIGGIVAEKRWVRNADVPMRIEHKGNLYKVKRDD